MITFLILLGHVQFGYMMRNKFFVSQRLHSLALSFTSTSLSCSHAHSLFPVLGESVTMMHVCTCVHRYNTNILHYTRAYRWFSHLVILEMVLQYALSSASRTRILIISRSRFHQENYLPWTSIDAYVFQTILKKDVLTSLNCLTLRAIQMCWLHQKRKHNRDCIIVLYYHPQGAVSNMTYRTQKRITRESPLLMQSVEHM